MKFINLTKGQIASVDDWWFEYLSQWKWHASWNPKTKSYYAYTNKKGGGRISMARVVAHTPDGMLCDHRDHDTLNNQEHNLRNCSNAQNQWNVGVKRTNLLRHKNIRIQKTGGFQVRIRKDKKCVFDRTFRTLDEAIAERDKAVLIFHAEFAYLGDI